MTKPFQNDMVSPGIQQNGKLGALGDPVINLKKVIGLYRFFHFRLLNWRFHPGAGGFTV